MAATTSQQNADDALRTAKQFIDIFTGTLGPPDQAYAGDDGTPAQTGGLFRTINPADNSAAVAGKPISDLQGLQAATGLSGMGLLVLAVAAYFLLK